MDNLPPSNPTQTTPTPLTNNKKIIILLFLFLSLAALIVAGAFFLKQQKGFSTPFTISTSPTKSELPPTLPPAGSIKVAVEIESTAGEAGKIKGKITATNDGPGMGNLYYNLILNHQIITQNGGTVEKTQGPLISYTESKDSFQLQSAETKTLPFEVDYSPHIAPGEYSLMATVITNLGIPLGTSPPKYLALTGTNDLVTFEGCKVIVNAKEHEPFMAPLIQKGGLAEGKCQFTNTTNRSLSLRYTNNYAVLHVLSYPDSKKLTQTSTEEITFAPRETKEVRFALPSDLEPQVYESYTSFIDSTGKSQSPVAIFRWTIQGQSGRVGDITLDKDYYTKGQVAKITATVAPSMDLFWGEAGTKLEAVKLLISLLNDKNELCGETTSPISGDFLTSKEVTIEVTAEKNCLNPSAEVRILSDDKELASGNTKILSSDASLETAQKARGIEFSPFLLALPVLVIIFIFLFWFIKKKKDKAATTLSMVFLFTTLASLLYVFYILNIGIVHADIRDRKINYRNDNGQADYPWSGISPKNPLYIILGYRIDGGNFTCEPGKFCARYRGDYNASVNWSGNIATVTFWGTITLIEKTCDNGTGAEFHIRGPGISKNPGSSPYNDAWLQTGMQNSGGSWNKSITFTNSGGPVALRYDFVLYGRTDAENRSDWHNGALDNDRDARFIEDQVRNQGGSIRLEVPAPSPSPSPPPPPATVSCSASPPTQAINQNVAWTAAASNFSGTPSYSWSNTAITTATNTANPGNTASFSKQYATDGSRTASVTATYGSQTASNSCSVSISSPFINTTGGDVHSNTGINTPGGP